MTDQSPSQAALTPEVLAPDSGLIKRSDIIDLLQRIAGEAVPREPTEAMMKAGQVAGDDKHWAWRGYGARKDDEGLDGMTFIVRDAYRAMLAAAPQAQSVSGLAEDVVQLVKAVRVTIDGTDKIEGYRELQDAVDLFASRVPTEKGEGQ